MASTDLFGSFLERERFRRTVEENSAKLAIYSDEVTTSGWGEIDLEDCIIFDSTFIERPTVSYGCALDEVDLIDGEYPRPFGFVRDWKQDQNGFYRGAWVSVVVSSAGVPVSAGYNLFHSFVFTGIALKPIREDLTADSDPLPNALLEVTPNN